MPNANAPRFDQIPGGAENPEHAEKPDLKLVKNEGPNLADQILLHLTEQEEKALINSAHQEEIDRIAGEEKQDLLSQEHRNKRLQEIRMAIEDALNEVPPDEPTVRILKDKK